MTAPRLIVPGRTYLVTRRCTQRSFLLRPDPRTTAIFLYCFAEAAQRCGIRTLGWMAMSNHYHAVVEDPEGRLPAFLEQFHKMCARALNAHRSRRENLWSTEPTCAVYLVNPEDVLEKVVYMLANPVADHLVERVLDWPGASSFAWLDGRDKTLRRPATFFRGDGQMPESVGLRAVAPTGTAAGEWARRVREAVAEREAAAREERRRKGTRVRGRKAVLRFSPFDRPVSSEPRRTLRPTIACRDWRRRVQEMSALKRFRQHYARARGRLLAGERGVVFPMGTYRWRLLGIACVPPPLV